MTIEQAEQLRKLFRQAREARARREPDRKMPRARVAELAARNATVDVEEHHVRFLETAVSSHISPEVARPIAAVLGIPWAQVLGAMGMA